MDTLSRAEQLLQGFEQLDAKYSPICKHASGGRPQIYRSYATPTAAALQQPGSPLQWSGPRAAAEPARILISDHDSASLQQQRQHDEPAGIGHSDGRWLPQAQALADDLGRDRLAVATGGDLRKAESVELLDSTSEYVPVPSGPDDEEDDGEEAGHEDWMVPSPPPQRRRDLSHHEWQRQNAAATIIQAAWRGFRTRAADPQCAAVRREIRTHRMETHIRFLSADLHRTNLRLQQEAQLRLLQQEALKMLWQEVKDLKAAQAQNHRQAQERAARTIQQMWRGFVARKKNAAVLRERLLDKMPKRERLRAAVASGNQAALIELCLHLHEQVQVANETLLRLSSSSAWQHASHASPQTLRYHHGPAMTATTAEPDAARQPLSAVPATVRPWAQPAGAPATPPAQQPAAPPSTASPAYVPIPLPPRSALSTPSSGFPSAPTVPAMASPPPQFAAADPEDVAVVMAGAAHSAVAPAPGAPAHLAFGNSEADSSEA